MPSHFRRVTEQDIIEAVSKAAKEKNKTKREAMLTDKGLNEASFIFDGKGLGRIR